MGKMTGISWTDPRRADVLATPVYECGACATWQRHAKADLVKHHPLAGHGRNGTAMCVCGSVECPYAPKVAS